MLYVQSDVADKLLEMLFGAMDELRVGDPWLLSTDIGPVIDLAAKTKIDNHCREMEEKGKLLKQIPVPHEGLFVAPTVIRLNGIEELDEEIFGPVLHVATFEADQIDTVVDTINAKGYGLTFGIHTRIDNRVKQIVKRVKAGNIYVNRNQIGAVVGSQPFGGEGLSGTGPKAGGPTYVQRFRKNQEQSLASKSSIEINAEQLQRLIADSNKLAVLPKLDEAMNQVIETLGFDSKPEYAAEAHDMPGPTGETNRLSVHARGLVLCLGPTREGVLDQAVAALALANRVVIIADGIKDALVEFKKAGLPVVGVEGFLSPPALTQVTGFDAVMTLADSFTKQAFRQALAEREGVLIPLITESNASERLIMERHLCIDTTAAGGNASLIAAGG